MPLHIHVRPVLEVGGGGGEGGLTYRSAGILGEP